MFSIVFPGQGSQKIGMANELFQTFNLVKNIFSEADKILGLPISKIILGTIRTEIKPLSR